MTTPAPDFFGPGAAGTGRIAIPLQHRGIQVEGIDLSPAMLAQLRGRSGGDVVRVEVGDMTSVRLGRTIGVVYLVFNSIGNVTTQEGQVAVFETAAAHLLPGGCLVVEVGVPDLQRGARPPGADRGAAAPAPVGGLGRPALHRAQRAARVRLGETRPGDPTPGSPLRHHDRLGWATVSQAPGLRDQKKADTRRRLAECAFALFVEHGFDAVTVADIATAAGVSVTTLFSYFPVKEALTFDVSGDQLSALTSAVRYRTPGTPVVDAVEAHAVRMLEATASDSEVRSRYVRLLQETPAIQHHIGATMLHEWRPDLARTLRESVSGLDEVEATIAAHHLLSALFMLTTSLDAGVAGRIFSPLRSGLGRLGA